MTNTPNASKLTSDSNLLTLPCREINSFCDLKLNYIKVKNFKAFEDVKFDFGDKKFICFIGPNGTGKSTIIEIIQLLFANFKGRTDSQMECFFQSCIRKTKEAQTDDFLIEAEFSSSDPSVGTYIVSLNKHGFIKDHPEKIKQDIYRICYFSSFDKELHKFQLFSSKWDKFKKLYESVTGFELELRKNIFNDAISRSLDLEDFVFDFSIKKTNETISCRDCSDGERKIMKSFSTILNMTPSPKIILIDNIEMHVEVKRHLNLIKSLKECFPDSQIFSTTHSNKISKDFNNYHEIYDLRLIYAPEHIKSNISLLYYLDEIDDLLAKNLSIDDLDLQKKHEKYLVDLRDCINTDSGLEGIDEKLTPIYRSIGDIYMKNIDRLKFKKSCISI